MAKTVEVEVEAGWVGYDSTGPTFQKSQLNSVSSKFSNVFEETINRNFVSGVDLLSLSQELKKNFVDCYTQSFAADPTDENMMGMTWEITRHVIAGEMVRAGSHNEETMTPTCVIEHPSGNPQVTYHADNDFMYVIDPSCLNDTIHLENAENPGFVHVILTEKKNLHNVVDAALIKKGEGYLLSPTRIKTVIKVNIEVIRELTEVSDIDFCFRGHYDIRCEVVGPSVRLIYSPLETGVLQSLIFSEFECGSDTQWNEDDERLSDYETEIKNMEVDFVPAIFFPVWPNQAEEWTTRDRKWPPPEIVYDVIKAGHHVVPKSSSDAFADKEWRISFSLSEGILLRSFHKYSWCKQCYRILKCLMKYHVTRPRIISTYHLKTIFLWTLEKYPPDTWTEENLGQRFLGLLDKLLHHISLRFLPQYFIPADNLFKNLNEDFVQIVVKVVSSMRQRPLDFIYRKNISPWNDEDTGMTIEEMLSWDDKPEEERYPGNNKLKDGCHDDSKHEDCRQGSKLEY